jgi:hypothetical protein
MNGKGSSPRNLSAEFRKNYDGIVWVGGNKQSRAIMSALTGSVVFRPKGRRRKHISEF